MYVPHNSLKSAINVYSQGPSEACPWMNKLVLLLIAVRETTHHGESWTCQYDVETKETQPITDVF